MTSIQEQFAVAIAHQEAGRLELAQASFADVLRSDPQHVEAWYRLGMLMCLTGNFAVSIDCLKKSIAFGGPRPDACNLLGLVFRNEHRLGDAEQSLRQAYALDPSRQDTLINLGVVLLEQRQPDEAVALFAQAVHANPNDVTARSNLGNALKELQRFDDAEVHYRAALLLAPDSIDVQNNLAAVLIALDRQAEAQPLLRRVIAAEPGMVEAKMNLGIALGRQAQEAIDVFREVLEQDDQCVKAWCGLGDALLHAGQPAEAAECQVRALALDPDDHVSRSNLIYCSQFLPGVTARSMSDLYKDWDRHHAQPLHPEHRRYTNSRDPDRRLRIGVLSPNLAAHPATYLTIGGFEHMDHSQFEMVYYSDREEHDVFSDRLRATSDQWHVVYGKSDEDLARQIHGDAIDILIVMAGHTGQNRQLLAARRPAPIQVAWTGDPSGQSAMDYLLADRFLVPEEFDEHYTETIMRMPHDYATFEVPSFAPEIGPSPVASNGYITFGSFNQAAKYHTELLEVWASIMSRTPDSRLILIGKALIENRDRLLAPFHAGGISPERIDMKNMVLRTELLDTYNRLDIALDSFPFSAGITTLEALWMGVPTVTLPSETFAGRTSLSHLWNAGLTDTTARDCDEYVEIAVQLASDHSRLAQLRLQLREQTNSSPICDRPGFARDLGDSLRTAWKKWALHDAT